MASLPAREGIITEDLSHEACTESGRRPHQRTIPERDGGMLDAGAHLQESAMLYTYVNEGEEARALSGGQFESPAPTAAPSRQTRRLRGHSRPGSRTNAGSLLDHLRRPCYAFEDALPTLENACF